VSRGLSNAQIAARRRVSTRTVANQLARLFEKLGVHWRLDALRVAGHRLGMTPEGAR
jgi:DNA-binding NarL/FixJ family response regulator